MPLTLEHIGADAQQLILLMCDFACLQSVLATSQQLSAHALTVLSSAAWRQSSINEDQLPSPPGTRARSRRLAMEQTAGPAAFRM